jgi:hypothetical protein
MSAVILMIPQLEAVLYFCRCSLRIEHGVGVWGGLSLVPLILINTAACGGGGVGRGRAAHQR